MIKHSNIPARYFKHYSVFLISLAICSISGLMYLWPISVPGQEYQFRFLTYYLSIPQDFFFIPQEIGFLFIAALSGALGNCVQQFRYLYECIHRGTPINMWPSYLLPRSDFLTWPLFLLWAINGAILGTIGYLLIRGGLLMDDFINLNPSGVMVMCFFIGGYGTQVIKELKKIIENLFEVDLKNDYMTDK